MLKLIHINNNFIQNSDCLNLNNRLKLNRNIKLFLFNLKLFNDFYCNNKDTHHHTLYDSLSV